jgi:phage baseplate assembly protein W
MSSRADKFTQTQKKQEFFSDFLNNFDKHPITNSVAKVTNEESVKQAIKNLILTDLGERLFEPKIGSGIKNALFEPNDIVSAETIVFQIQNCIRFNEPRVDLYDVRVLSSPDGGTFNVTIVFGIINNVEPITLNLILRRVR